MLSLFSMSGITMTSQYVSSPMNYIGGKYKLLPQLLPLFPKNVDTFVDLFCGGANVGVNALANRIVFNDNLVYLVDLSGLHPRRMECGGRIPLRAVAESALIIRRASFPRPRPCQRLRRGRGKSLPRRQRRWAGVCPGPPCRR